MSSWKRDAASGLVVVLPILITIYILVYLYLKLAGVAPEIIVSNDPNLNKMVGVVVTIIVFTLIVFSVGYLMRTALGSLVEEAIDNVANRVPVLRVVYNASKMAAETAISGPGDLQKPVKLEVSGVRMTAFKTGKVADDGRELIFMPTAPNITTGFVLEVNPDQYIETDETVEEALTRILSAGFGETEQSGIRIDVTEEDAGPQVSD